MTSSKFIETYDLSKEFPLETGVLQYLVTRLQRREMKALHAVSRVSLSVDKGETLGLVGESGCGKSTLGKCILRLLEPTSGRVWFDGNEVTSASKEALRNLRPKMQMVFQDPYSSLNPRRTVRDILGHALEVGGFSADEDRLRGLVEMVGLSSEHLDRYPHQFSGGQKQRIAIGRALAPDPKFIVADEPVSSLDVSIQSQIINLIGALQKKLGLTILFITHDLRVVEYLSTRVVVMYMGKVVESAVTGQLFDEPLHPYTTSLLSAVPLPDPRRGRERKILKGELPNPLNLPRGCSFQSRCPYVQPICKEVEPVIVDVGGNHQVACHLHHP